MYLSGISGRNCSAVDHIDLRDLCHCILELEMFYCWQKEPDVRSTLAPRSISAMEVCGTLSMFGTYFSVTARRSCRAKMMRFRPGTSMISHHPSIICTAYLTDCVERSGADPRWVHAVKVASQSPG